MAFESIGKTVAFIKKEFVTSLSYRYSFFSGIIFSLIAFLFYFAMADVFKIAVITELIPYGGNYVAFIITGAMLWQIVTLGLYSISSKFTLEMFTGTLETIYLSRTNILLVLIGVSLFSLLTNLALVIVSLLIAVLIFNITIYFNNIVLAFLILVLTYLSMLGFGMIFAGITIVTKSIGQLVSVFTLFLSFISGVLFPIELLPETLQQLSALSPLTYALDALRNVLLVGTGFEGITAPLAMLALISVVLIPIGYKTFFVCLNIAKKQGTLAQF